MLESKLKISLVVPMYNEEDTLAALVESINRQTFSPSEVVLVDGASTDRTVEVFDKLCRQNPIFKLIKAEPATPGKGRNIGIENAANEWIALTDAGISLDENWLAELVKTLSSADPETAVVYGNFSPVINSFFEKLATLAYVAPLKADAVRTKCLPSTLLKKEVWSRVGGFPDLRAAEDLIFMEKIDEAQIKIAFAPKALVFWQLRPTVGATFAKFVLYSKLNVWINRQWDWHYGVLRQYILLIPFIILGFAHSPWWFLIIAGWFCARTAKRILRHRYEFGLAALFNPLTFFGTMFLTLVIDLATFIGWIQAGYQKKPNNFTEIHA